MVTIIVDKKYKMTKLQLVEKLLKYNIVSRPFFYPLSSLPPYKTKVNNPVAYSISEYAINKAVDGYANFLIKNQSLSEEKAREKEEETRKKVLPHMIVGNCEKLPWPDNSFDVVLSINTTHNLPIELLFSQQPHYKFSGVL